MNLDPVTNFSIVLIALLVVIGIFVLLRSVVLWYFRINEIVSLLKRQNELLEIISTERSRNVSRPTITRNPLSPTARTDV